MKKLFLLASLFVLVGAGCTDYHMNQKVIVDAQSCLDVGGEPYMPTLEQVNCEFR